MKSDLPDRTFAFAKWIVNLCRLLDARPVVSRTLGNQLLRSSTSVDVRDFGNRWALCSPSGMLAFHWKCMMAPLAIIDYIVVHELCHIHHRDHTDTFWNEVDKVAPDYRERKIWLRKNGAGLDI